MAESNDVRFLKSKVEELKKKNNELLKLKKAQRGNRYNENLSQIKKINGWIYELQKPQENNQKSK